MADAMKVGLVLSATDKMSRVVGQATRKSMDNLNKFSAASKHISSAWALAGGAAIVGGIMSASNEAGKQLKANKRLEHVFKSMWGPSGAVKLAAIQQEEFADKLSLQTGIDAEVIKMTQAKLATFKNVSNKTAVMSHVFERATRAAQDMAAVGFGEATQNAVILGKALEDPARMATALKKMGTVTANDVVNLKAIAATKGLAAAQEYLLKAVERQVGGSAEATASATELMSQSWKRVNEALGKSFLPNLKKGKVASSGFAMSLVSLINKHPKLIQNLTYTGLAFIGVGLAIKGIGSAVTFYSNAVKLISLVNGIAGKSMLLFKLQYYGLVASQKLATLWTGLTTSSVWAFTAALLANPVTWVVVGIMALVAGLVLAWKKFETFRAVIKTTWEVVKGFGGILKEYVLDRIRGIISGFGSLMRAFNLFRKGKFADAGSEALKGIKDLTGVTAAQKAMKRTVVLAQTIKPTYSKILAVEKSGVKDKEKATVQAHRESKIVQLHAANKSQSVKTLSTVKSNVSNTPQITYAPVIHVNGGSPTAKVDFMKALKDNQKEVEQFLKKIVGNQQRVSYTPIV